MSGSSMPQFEQKQTTAPSFSTSAAPSILDEEEEVPNVEITPSTTTTTTAVPSTRVTSSIIEDEALAVEQGLHMTPIFDLNNNVYNYSNFQWQMYARSFMSMSFLFLSFGLWFFNLYKSPMFTLLAFSGWSVLILSFIYIGSMINLFDSGIFISVTNAAFTAASTLSSQRMDTVRLIDQLQGEEAPAAPAMQQVEQAFTMQQRSIEEFDFLSIGTDFIGCLFIGTAFALIYKMSLLSPSFTTMFLASCWISDGSNFLARLLLVDFLRLFPRRHLSSTSRRRGQSSAYLPLVAPMHGNLESLVFAIIGCATFCFFYKPITFIPFKLFSLMFGSSTATSLSWWTSADYLKGDLFYNMVTPYNCALIGGTIAILCFVSNWCLWYMKQNSRVKFTGDMFYDFGGVLDVCKGMCFSALPMYCILSSLYLFYNSAQYTGFGNLGSEVIQKTISTMTTSQYQPIAA